MNFAGFMDFVAANAGNISLAASTLVALAPKPVAGTAYSGIIDGLNWLALNVGNAKNIPHPVNATLVPTKPKFVP